MKIVGFDEFCEMPEGTIFSYFEPCVTEGLYRLGEVVFSKDNKPIDFFETSLKAECHNGAEPVVDLIESRWGMYDYLQEFAVYEGEDIAVIRKGLETNLPGFYVDASTGILAAQALEKLAKFAYENPASPPELHDLAAKVLDMPSLCHGFHPGPQRGPSSVAKVEAESKAIRKEIE